MAVHRHPHHHHHDLMIVFEKSIIFFLNEIHAAAKEVAVCILPLDFTILKSHPSRHDFFSRFFSCFYDVDFVILLFIHAQTTCSCAAHGANTRQL